MSKSKQDTPDTTQNKNGEGNGAATAAPEEQLQARSMPIKVHAQYIKDLSFENPNAPDTLRPQESGPKMDININLDARGVDDKDLQSLYEVVLTLSATAKRGEETVFLAELHYAAVAQLDGVPQEQHHPALLIEVPRMIFPYARQVLSDMTAGGGYPPLLLNPVDFHAMYLERFKDEISQARIGQDTRPEKQAKKA